jgi:HlyD family secretion protein
MKGRTKVIMGGLGVVGLGLVANLVFGRGDGAAEVRVETIQARDLVSTITATGNVRPRRQVNISSDVMGRVVELKIEEGDEVERGSLLLRIDPSAIQAQVSRARAARAQAQAQVSQARANLLQAERDLERLQSLRARDPDLVSGQALEEAQTRLEIQRATVQSAEFGAAQAAAQLEEVEEQQTRTTIIAPISGRVTRLNIEEGETAVVGTMNNPGSLLLTISDLSIIEAVLSVDETDVPRISLGDSAVVELDAFPGRRFAGEVSRIGNSAIQASGGQARASVDFEVVLTLLDPPAELRPDLSATAEIIVDRRQGATSVPIVSVTLRSPLEGEGEGGEAEEEGVFVLDQGVVRWRPVTLGMTGATHFEVLSGLSVGEQVVSGPFQQILALQDGNPVRVLDGSGTPTAR